MRPDVTLCLVTDRRALRGVSLPEAVSQALRGGCTMVQLREKAAGTRTFYALAMQVKAVTDAWRVPLIINDRADVALAVGAAGLHIGQSDLPLRAARRLLPNALIGVSVTTVEEALTAAGAGADYLGVGAMFPSTTKPDAAAVSLETLRLIRRATGVPLLAIGGVNAANAPLLRAMGADGVAAISAILGQPDIALAARRILERFLCAQPPSR